MRATLIILVWTLITSITLNAKPRTTRVYDHSAELLAMKNAYDEETLHLSAESEKGAPSGHALTLDIRHPGASPYAVNLQFFHPNDWKKGDKGVISFWCRSLSTKNRFGASSLKIQYKPDYADWRGHAESDLYLEKEWKRVAIPFEVAIQAPETERCALNFFLGGVDPHVIQLAELQVLAYGPEAELADLPRSKAYYPGMEIDAPWRKAANERIEQYRKADARLKIVDADGAPVDGATVRARLLRHHFGFGAAVRTPLLASPETSAEIRGKYSDVLTRTCSKITPTNAMKWRLYPHFKQYVPDLIEWCAKHDMTLRGHLFIWPGFERLPDGYDLHETDPKAFREDLTDHIEEFANLHPDAFSEWDVLNEPYTEHDFMDLLGKDVVLDWFETARAANPSYLTYINDFGILSDNNAEHRDNYYEWIQYLVDHDAPLDGIGFQGHFRTATPPELILERIDRYAVFGKSMQITEFDFDHTDSELQARFFEDFVTLIYSHPEMSALINWIFVEDDFRPTAALYRADFTPTPMGEVWERLITQRWHTEATRSTGADGALEFRGFKGLYEIEIEYEGRVEHRRFEMTDDARERITL